MRMKYSRSLSVFVGLVIGLGASDAVGGAIDLVNCFIGTEGDGHCWPGATVPFALVQPSPDTGYQGWDYVAGYRHSDSRILGFSQTHNSGGGGPIFGDVGIMPDGDDGRKASETAHPGYYRVDFTSGVSVEIAATAHGAFYRMAFPEKRKGANIRIDLNSGICNATWARKAIEILELDDSSPAGLDGLNLRNGYVRNRRVGYSVRFDPQPIGKRVEGREHVYSFDLTNRHTVEIRVALSAVSREGAIRNRRIELDARTFDEICAAATAWWTDLLGRVELDPTTDRDTAVQFYTGLYRMMSVPSNIADVGEEPFYSEFSLWDTFRGVHPFYSIILPEMVSPLVNSLLRQGERTGYLPIMPNWGQETQCMIGTHSVPVIVDAFLKGFGGVDWEKAYAMICDTLKRSHPERAKERWDILDRYGFYPCDILSGEGVSRTLECSYDDWCAMKMAERLGRREDAAFFARRSEYWRNVFDSKTGFMRGRRTDGSWREPFDPYKYGHGASGGTDFTEGNAYQWRWHVLQDADGLIEALGGKTAAAMLIEELFDKVKAFTSNRNATGLWGGYAQGNEPVHHVPYLLSLCGRRDLAALRIRGICDRFYRNAPDGLCGNEDHGEMSAWYVFACLGFYPVNPVSGEFVIGAPQVPGATLRLAGDKVFRIVAQGLSAAAKYVRSVSLNGLSLKSPLLKYGDIVAGGELVYEMTDSEKESW